MGYKASYMRFKRGERLSRKQAVEAQCYECNGYTAEIKNDCLGGGICPLYGYSIWGKVKKKS